MYKKRSGSSSEKYVKASAAREEVSRVSCFSMFDNQIQKCFSCVVIRCVGYIVRFSGWRAVTNWDLKRGSVAELSHIGRKG